MPQYRASQYGRLSACPAHFAAAYLPCFTMVSIAFIVLLLPALVGCALVCKSLRTLRSWAAFSRWLMLLSSKATVTPSRITAAAISSGSRCGKLHKYWITLYRVDCLTSPGLNPSVIMRRLYAWKICSRLGSYWHVCPSYARISVLFVVFLIAIIILCPFPFLGRLAYNVAAALVRAVLGVGGRRSGRSGGLLAILRSRW